MTRRLLAGLAAAVTIVAGLPMPVIALSHSANAEIARPVSDDGSGARRASRLAISPPHSATSSVPAAAAPCDDTFRVVSSPSPGTASNGLNAVSAVSASDAWAVGGSLATGSLFQTLIEHSDGTQWTTVQSANNTGEDLLFGVAAINSNDAWAVGYWRTDATAVRQPLVEHWNGTVWTIISFLTTGGGDNALLSVTAASSTDVWAVGYWRSSNTLPRNPLAGHWDGHTWTIQTAPTQGTGSNVFYSVASMSGAIWAVGYWRTDDTSGTRHPLLELWNGTAWVAGSAPFQGTGDSVLYAVAAISAGDFWAVGYQEATPGAVVQNLTYHYSGPAGSTGPWVYVPSPNASAALDNLFIGVGATSSGDVWAVGEYGSNTAPFQGVAVQWNGTAWAMVPVANFSGTTELLGVWAISKRNVLAVGDYLNGTVYQTLVEQLCSADKPSAPTAVVAGQFALNGGINVGWQPPSQDGGAPITSYRVNVYLQGTLWDATYVGGSPPSTVAQYYASSFGSTYTFTVAAYNLAGWSPESVPSSPIVLITSPYPPVNLQTLAGHGEATVLWTAQHAPGRPITGWTIKAWQAGYPGTGPTIQVPADASYATINGLTDGIAYSVDVEATNVMGTSATTLGGPVTPTAVPLGNPVALLPAIANGAYGGYTTVTSIQNVTGTPANVTVKYFDAGGNLVGAGNSVAALPANASWLLRNDNPGALPVGTAGSAIVYSDQPVAAFVNEFAPSGGDATGYTGINPISGTGRTLFAPAIANGAYGGYTTGIGLVNLSSSSATITVTYRGGTGTVVKTQTLNNIPAGAYQGLYSGDASLGLPAGFAGTATIVSSAGNLAAVVNETGPGGQFSSYDAVPAGSATLFAPAALNNAFGGYFTGMGIQNTTGSAGTVTITYYDSLGSATTKTFPIVANGYLGIYQGSPTDGPAPGAYTARINSTVPIAAIVNEVAPAGSGAQQSTAYNTVPAGSATLHLPLVESAGPDGWSTGDGIMNTGTAATTVTVTYYDAATGAPVGTPQSQLLQPNAFWGLYQPAGGLPSGTRASAVITTSPAGQVAVVCNESNATTFMSYSGQ
jgi:hypothetical protein